MTTDERRALCEAVTRRLLDRLRDDMNFLKDNGIGVTIFAFTFEPGALAYLSTSDRADMIRTIKEWVAYQEAGLTTEPRGERGRG